MPSGGVENAPLLKNSERLGSESCGDRPVRSARSEQLVPCATSNAAPQMRIVNGVPDCRLHDSVAVQPPRTLATIPP